MQLYLVLRPLKVRFIPILLKLNLSTAKALKRITTWLSPTELKTYLCQNFEFMAKPVRVRFAPSPTGPLHIGGVRTALFNYLFAKKHGGVFYLRIEDTDQNRFVPGAEAYIFEALEWLGISPSETVGKNEKFGPYRQSERKALYGEYAQQLIASGHAYYAFDSNEALDQLRKEEESIGQTFIYNWHNRQKLDNFLLSYI